MTREQKIQKRKQRAFLRKQKRKAKDESYMQIARSYDRNSVSWGRKRAHGSVFSCEMGYTSCEIRGYCNGDC